MSFSRIYLYIIFSHIFVFIYSKHRFSCLFSPFNQIILSYLFIRFGFDNIIQHRGLEEDTEALNIQNFKIKGISS